MPSSRGKVAILNHGYLPHYRVRFYELLAERGGFDYIVFHGAPKPPEAIIGRGGLFQAWRPAPWIAEHWRE